MNLIEELWIGQLDPIQPSPEAVMVKSRVADGYRNLQQTKINEAVVQKSFWK
jgi:hypothetical protein